MRRLAAVAALALGLAAAGCGSRGAVTAPGSSGWTPTGKACDTGGPGCISLISAAMTTRYRPLAAACDDRAPFALMYLRVTQGVGRDETGFADRSYLVRLDAAFARLYFDAFDAWGERRRSAVPLAWQIAFEAAAGRRVSVLGDLLLGMNAHISRDLPYAVSALGLSAARKRSFEQVNTVLERVTRPILQEEARRFDPAVTRFSLPVLSASPGTLGAVLAGWRNSAMRDAERLMHAKPGAAREAVARSIDQTAAARAALIAAATTQVPFSQAGKSRQAYCRARR